MKKLMILSLAIGTLSTGAAFAQKSRTPQFGIRGGLNLANIIKDNNSKQATEIKPGFNAAVFLDLPLTTGLSLQPELQYSQKGYKSSGSFLGSPYEYTANTNYVEVPILAKISPTPTFSIVVGPQFSFLTSTDYKFKTANTNYQNVVENDNNNIRKNTLGGVAGIEIGTGNVILAARYSLDFQQNNGDGTSATPKYKNQVFGLSLGFKL